MGARATSQPIPADTRPVVLDLDNTLIRTNVLHELTLAYLKGNPLRAFQLALWLTRGKAYLKDQLSRRVTLDTDLLPVNEEVVASRRRSAAGSSLPPPRNRSLRAASPAGSTSSPTWSGPKMASTSAAKPRR